MQPFFYISVVQGLISFGDVVRICWCVALLYPWSQFHQMILNLKQLNR